MVIHEINRTLRACGQLIIYAVTRATQDATVNIVSPNRPQYEGEQDQITDAIMLDLDKHQLIGERTVTFTWMF